METFQTTREGSRNIIRSQRVRDPAGALAWAVVRGIAMPRGGRPHDPSPSVCSPACPPRWPLPTPCLLRPPTAHPSPLRPRPRPRRHRPGGGTARQRSRGLTHPLCITARPCAAGERDTPRYLIPTTSASWPASGSMRVARKPASRIQVVHSAPVKSNPPWVSMSMLRLMSKP